MTKFIFKGKDGTKISEIEFDLEYCVAPKVVIHEGKFFLRITDDSIHDPVEFIRVSGVIL